MLPGGVTYVTGLAQSPTGSDVQLKNQPASMLPGGVTYVTGLATSGGKVGFANTERLRLLRELSAIRRELAKAAPKPRPLSRAKRDILQALEAMSPEDLSLQKEVLIGKVQDKVGHARSTIYPILDDFLESRRR
jgi:hypothetical protein